MALPARERLLEQVEREGVQAVCGRLKISNTYLHMLLGRAPSPKSSRLPSMELARLIEDTYGIPMRGWVDTATAPRRARGGAA